MEGKLVSIRYVVNVVQEAIDFYTRNCGSTIHIEPLAAFADVVRGSLGLLLAGPNSPAGRPLSDGRKPQPGGWRRIHFIVDDVVGEVDRLRGTGVRLPDRERPGGRQMLLEDPSSNSIELFQLVG